MPRCGTSLCQRAMRARFPKRPFFAAPSRPRRPTAHPPSGDNWAVLYTIRRPPRNCAAPMRGARGPRREIELEEQGGGGEWSVNLHAPPPALTSNSENGVGSKCGCSRFLLCSTCRLTRMLTVCTYSLLLPTHTFPHAPCAPCRLSPPTTCCPRMNTNFHESESNSCEFVKILEHPTGVPRLKRSKLEVVRGCPPRHFTK